MGNEGSSHVDCMEVKMGFARRKRRKVKGFIYIAGIILIVLVISGSVYYLIQNRLKLIENIYLTQIENLKYEAYLNHKVVYVPTTFIESGSIITADQVLQKTIISDLEETLYITSQDFGKYSIADLEANIPIMRFSVAEEFLPDDIREQEFHFFQLPTYLGDNQYIDVRISFPNGEDYIVLTKKKVQQVNLETNTLWLWLSEKEILQISSATVDAYIQEGTCIYTTVYVEPSLQEAAVVTYPVNASVLVLIQDNPNIVAEAKGALSIESRMALESRLVGDMSDIDWSIMSSETDEIQLENKENSDNGLTESSQTDSSETTSTINIDDEIVDTTNTVNNTDDSLQSSSGEGVVGSENFFD